MDALLKEEEMRNESNAAQLKSLQNNVEVSRSKKHGYNLKNELEELVGLTDFTKKLNEVNFIIGIIVLLGLFAYFIL